MPFWKFSILFSWFCHFSLLEISFNLFLSNASSFNAIAKCSRLRSWKILFAFFHYTLFSFRLGFFLGHTHIKLVNYARFSIFLEEILCWISWLDIGLHFSWPVFTNLIAFIIKLNVLKSFLVSAFYSRAECEVSRKVYHTLPPPFILNKCSRQLFYRLRQLKSSRRSGASNLYPDWNFRIKVSIEFCRT